jgi:hypothetical protein
LILGQGSTDFFDIGIPGIPKGPDGSLTDVLQKKNLYFIFWIAGSG